jgi:MFS family permease
VFALGPGFFWACSGRFLIGGSVAVAFVGLLQVANNWFPPRYYAMVTGVALFVGIIGAVCAGPPLRLLVDSYSWRAVISGSAAFTFLIAGAIWLFVRDFPHQKGYRDLRPLRDSGHVSSYRNTVKGIFEVFRSPNAVLLFLIPGGIVGSVLTFSGLWGVPFLASHHGLTTAGASALTSSVLVAWAVGGPIFGWVSDRIGRRKILYIAGCAVCLAGWTAAFWIPDISMPVLIAALLTAGFGSGCMILTFAFAKESVPAHLSGTVSGAMNMGVMMGTMLLQPAVGWVLDSQWDGRMVEGVRSYGLHAYRAGFSLMLAWLALALLLLCFTRETRCRQIA